MSCLVAASFPFFHFSFAISTLDFPFSAREREREMKFTKTSHHHHSLCHCRFSHLSTLPIINTKQAPLEFSPSYMSCAVYKVHNQKHFNLNDLLSFSSPFNLENLRKWNAIFKCKFCGAKEKEVRNDLINIIIMILCGALF